MSKSVKPPCADWQVWMGPEVEGESKLGHKTLFIRALPEPKLQTLYDIVKKYPDVRRAWFCSVFKHYKIIWDALNLFEEVCLEVMVPSKEQPPGPLLMRARVYYKFCLPLFLKKGDHVCFGVPYADESFEIGKGRRVSPEKYMSDWKIL
jgi:hypothetical protein